MFRALISIMMCLVINIIVLGIWHVVDPYRSSLQMVDEVRMLGKYTCTSTYLPIWVSFEIVFFGINLLWGVFVIYETWSFQKKSVILETRWVLIALYNVVLNGAVLIPTLSTQPPDDDTISLSIIVSIDFSATGIIFAVLGPTTYHAFWGSRSSTSKMKGSTQEASHKGSKKKIEEISNDHITSSPSRADVSDREIEMLVNPQPLNNPDSLDSSGHDSQRFRSTTEPQASVPEIGVLTTASIPEDPLEWSANPVLTTT